VRRQDQARSRCIVWNGVIAVDGAARYLQIDKSVAHAVAPDHLTKDEFERRSADWHPEFDLARGAFQSIKMFLLVHESAAHDRTNLVDGIGELKTAIFDMHLRLRMAHIMSVDVGDPSPRRNQSRPALAIHVDKVSPIFVPGAMSCAGRIRLIQLALVEGLDERGLTQMNYCNALRLSANLV